MPSKSGGSRSGTPQGAIGFATTSIFSPTHVLLGGMRANDAPERKTTKTMKTLNQITKTRTSNLKIISLALLALLPAILCSPSSILAQTNSLASPEQTFFQTAVNYFTSANTNYAWTGNTLEIAAGADYMSSVNWANYLDAQYDLGSFAFEAKMRNAGIAGTVDSVQAGIQYTLIRYYSIKLEVGLDGGYDLDRNSAIFEPKLTLRAKLTPNTFAGVCLSLPILTNGKPINNVPDIGLEAGFTY
jgi:hypothetical protein